MDEIAETNGSMTRLDYALYQVGVQQRLVVLYMPDYVTQQTRLSQSSAAWLGMGRMLPEYDITLPLCPDLSRTIRAMLPSLIKTGARRRRGQSWI